MAGQRARAVVDVNSAAFERSLAARVANIVIEREEESLEIGYEIRNSAARHSPVDTGRLKAGWEVREGKDEQGYFVEVVNTVGYAAEVDGGTETTQAQPMIRPAIAEAMGVQGVSVRVIPDWQEQ